MLNFNNIPSIFENYIGKELYKTLVNVCNKENIDIILYIPFKANLRKGSIRAKIYNRNNHNIIFRVQYDEYNIELNVKENTYMEIDMLYFEALADEGYIITLPNEIILRSNDIDLCVNNNKYRTNLEFNKLIPTLYRY